MKRTAILIPIVTLIALAALLTPGLAAAQGGPNLPSASGGIPGGPGMSGAASIPTAPQVSVPQVSPPSFQPPSFEPPTFEPPSGFNGLSGLGQGERPQIGQGAQGERPQIGQGAQGTSMQFGSGFSPFNMDSATGQWSRFGDRGSGNLALNFSQPGEGQSWFELGGFGTPTLDGSATGERPTVQNLEQTGARPEAWPEEMPSAPAAYDEIRDVTELQAQAQDAVTQATEHRDEVTGDIQATIDAASTQAQAAYDQFWQDYYDAVAYTAQSYYAVATATADYLLETYYVAVDYALVAVDYYLAYYDQYVNYCYFYPWDCYMYAYDAAMGVYYYVGDVSEEPVAQVEIGDVYVNTTYPVPVEPQPSADAYSAVVLFANDQLGAAVEPLYAGEATEQVELMMQAMPPEMQAFLLRTMETSCADYWALISGGVAAVAAADCSAGSQPVTDLHAELTTASAGAYMLHTNSAMPATASEALSLITTVYPALTGLAFAEITDIETGMAFTATAAGIGVDPATGASLSVPKVIYAGVVSVNGQAYVYALVGVGEAYVDLIATGASAAS